MRTLDSTLSTSNPNGHQAALNGFTVYLCQKFAKTSGTFCLRVRDQKCENEVHCALSATLFSTISASLACELMGWALFTLLPVGFIVTLLALTLNF